MATRRKSGSATAPAPLVFIGHVVKAKAAALPDIAASNTAIVAVDHVVAAPALFASIAGSEITVRFGRLSIPPVGSSRTFHATGWIYGASLAVDAVKVGPSQDQAEAAVARRTEQSSAKDSALAARLDAAHMGVVGEVTSVRPLDVPTTHISEHDPAWHEATIKVDEVVKGRRGTREVNVVFPDSDDVRWRKVPKYHEGQQGIWLLHRGAVPDSHGLAPKAAAALPQLGDALTAVNRNDYLPLEELGRVKALLQK